MTLLFSGDPAPREGMGVGYAKRRQHEFSRIPDAEDLYHHRPPLSIFLSLLPVSHIFGGGRLVQKSRRNRRRASLRWTS